MLDCSNERVILAIAQSGAACYGRLFSVLLQRATHLFPARGSSTLSMLDEQMARPHLPIGLSSARIASCAAATSQVVSSGQPLEVLVGQTLGLLPSRSASSVVVKVWQLAGVAPTDFPG